MTPLTRTLRRLRLDHCGAVAVEFGFVAPVLFLMLLGFFDIGHSLFMRAMIEGELQRAARGSGLETGGTVSSQTSMDNRVRAQVRALHKNATVTFNRRFFKTFTRAAARQPEPWVDADNNRQCRGESFTDENNNGVHDMDGGNQGQGGAKDYVIYSVTVTYPRLFPLMSFIGASRNVTFSAATVMGNQPYGDQSTYAAPTTRMCPA
jgi:Flp pilus assembly pilin Flp